MGYYVPKTSTLVKVGKGAQGATTLLSKVLTPGKLTIFFLVLLLSTVGSIIESAKIGNPTPLIIDVGGKVFNADALLYHESTNVAKRFSTEPIEEVSDKFRTEKGFWNWILAIWAHLKRFWNIIMFYANIIASLYTMFMMYFVWVWIFKTHNDSETFWNYFFAGVFMFLISIPYGAFIYYEIDHNIPQAEDTVSFDSVIRFGKAINPVKGLIYTVSHHNEVFGNLYGPVKRFIPAMPDNSFPPVYNESSGAV